MGEIQEISSEKDKGDLLSSLSKWPNVAAFITSVTIAISVVYNYSYFSTFDITLIQYLSLQDHVASALIWLPKALRFYGFQLGIEFVSKTVWVRKEEEKAERLILKFESKYKFMNYVVRNRAQILLFLFIFGLIPVSFFEKESEEVPYFIYIYTWFVIFMTSYRRSLALSGRVLLLIFVGAYLLMDCLISGNTSALSDMRAIKGNAVVELTNGDKIDNVIILRKIQNGVLLRDVSNNKSVFMPYDQVHSIITDEKFLSDQTYFCNAFHFMCGH